jgi:hypothetical protein
MANGAEIVAAAERKLGATYVFGARVPLDDADWIEPWDCAEYCSWAVFQASKRIYGCTDNNSPPSKADAWTGSWKRDALSLGIKVSVAEASNIVGAMLLRRGASSGHIVISDGTGNGTLEARGADFGVMRHVVAGRVWDMGVLVPGIEYDTTRAKVRRLRYESPFTFRVLERGVQQGDPIAQVQEILRGAGYYDGAITGRYDVQTEIAVRDFQIGRGLTPDGQVESDTAAELGVTLSAERVQIRE